MPDATSRSLNVFLCHSSDDKPTVRELYRRLDAEGWIDSWLDEEKLYPGQDWNYEIERAVETADVIIVCLTKNSVNKEGYVQRELRIILDLADYKPEGTLFIIPVRLEDCEPPRRLRRWQYADYFPQNDRNRAYGRLLASLRNRAKALGPTTDELQALPVKAQDVENHTKATVFPDEKLSEPSVGLNEQVNTVRIAEIETSGAKESPLEQHEDTSQVDEEEQDNLSFVSEVSKPGQQIMIQEQLTSKPLQIVLNADSEIQTELANWGDMQFCLVRKGKFVMGDEIGGMIATVISFLMNADQNKQHVFNIPYDYWIARFPITSAQYAIYALPKGIKHPVDNWRDRGDYPIVNVTWNDASAYCLWLNEWIKSELPADLVVRLPTEAEWEKAARGPDAREWPWGDEFDKGKCNSAEGMKGSITRIGLYSPQGDSPYGCGDMVGNVFEWTHSKLWDYPYRADISDSESSVLSKIDSRVIRGGSYSSNKLSARCASRQVLKASNYQADIGFRVVIAPKLSAIMK